MRFLDAHNHLQDERFAGRQEALIAEARGAGVVAMVVNGACAEDWPLVAELADRHPGFVRPSFGWHPWYLHERGPGWEAGFESWLEQRPDAVVGEIGIDRWILDQPAAIRGRYVPALGEREPECIAAQEAVFRFQAGVARRRGLPFTVHCLQAWGRLEALLRELGPFPHGFLLHSYGGPADLVPVFAGLGAYFSFPGYFLHERKARQLDVFRRVPEDRLLVETDAPDQSPPEAVCTHRLEGGVAGGRPLNHPANLPAIQGALAAALGREPEAFATRLESNFLRLFGPARR